MVEELKHIGLLWAAAIVSNDVAAIGSFMSDDWVMVSTNGTTTKEAFLSVIRSGALTHNRMDYDETQVHIHENTAWVINKGTSAGTYNGAPFSLYEWSTDIFVRQNGKWLCVHTMLTPAKPNEAMS